MLLLQFPSIKGLSFASLLCSALFLFAALLTSPFSSIFFYISFPYQPNRQTFMGCCPSHPYNHPATPPYNSAAKLTANSSPPLPLQDDVKETVKEVLTETQPLPSKTPVFDPNNLVKDRSFRQPKRLASNKDSKSRIPLTLPLPPDNTSEDHASEICSRSESFISTADDNSSSGALLRTVASKNEGRCSNSSRSPAKRPPAQTQSPGSAAAATAPARRNVRRTQEHSPGRGWTARVVGGAKEDLGERSARRSRSPATRVGRTESGRRTDPSPGRSRRQNAANREELIENPLVSLECFIFL